jgi:predicted 3-demethylubiquinone-9 3-methyltransferase (glyoxalase superfamily)
MQKITPFLWFDNNAQEAADYYVSIFKNGKILNDMRASGDAPYKQEEVMVVRFELEGQEFMALNGGPNFKFNEAVSFMVTCDTQEEIDYFWNKLTADGGEESMCGWLKDKYGLSWQITPSNIGDLLGNPDREKAGRAMNAMMQMRKFDMKAMQDAFDGKSTVNA